MKLNCPVIVDQKLGQLHSMWLHIEYLLAHHLQSPWVSETNDEFHCNLVYCYGFRSKNSTSERISSGFVANKSNSSNLVTRSIITKELSSMLKNRLKSLGELDVELSSQISDLRWIFSNETYISVLSMASMCCTFWSTFPLFGKQVLDTDVQIHNNSIIELHTGKVIFLHGTNCLVLVNK